VIVAHLIEHFADNADPGEVNDKVRAPAQSRQRAGRQ